MTRAEVGGPVEQHLGILQGAPAKGIWIGLGDCSTVDVERLLRRTTGWSASGPWMLGRASITPERSLDFSVDPGQLGTSGKLESRATCARMAFSLNPPAASHCWVAADYRARSALWDDV